MKPLQDCIRIAGLVVYCCLLLVGRAQAIPLYVPQYFTTIQEAIDNALAGDEVLVAGGLYNEDIDFLGKAIVVRSLAGPANTTISGTGAGAVITFNNGEGSNSVLSGFTISGGAAQLGGGIYIGAATAPTIDSCHLIGNAATDGGGGLYAHFSASPLISHCLVKSNQAPFGGGIALVGGALQASPSGSPRIVASSIEQNSATAGNGGGLYADNNLHLEIQNCRFAGNHATVNGGGLYVHAHTVILDKSKWLHNRADVSGGGLYAAHSGHMEIVNCIIADNFAGTDGGGATFYHVDPYVIHTTVSANRAQWYGAGFQLVNATDGHSVNSVYWGNTLTYNGSSMDIQAQDPATFTMVFCDYGVIDGNTIVTNNCFQSDPLFVDPGQGNYELQMTSPCIDTGSDWYQPALPGDDINGTPRPQSGTLFGPAEYDLGAFEYRITLVPQPISP